MAPTPTGEERSALEDAKAFLESVLRTGPVSAKRIYAEAREAGHAERTIRRAQKALGIQPMKEGMKEPWTWALPPKMANNAEDVHPKKMDAFGVLGHLRQASAINSDPDAEIIQ